MTRKYVLWHGNLNVTFLLELYRQSLSLQGSKLSFRIQTGKVTFDTEKKSQESNKNRKKPSLCIQVWQTETKYLFLYGIYSVSSRVSHLVTPSEVEDFMTALTLSYTFPSLIINFQEMP